MSHQGMGERTHRRRTKEVLQQVRRNVRLLLRPNGSLVTAHLTSFSMISDSIIICPAAGDCKTILRVFTVPGTMFRFLQTENSACVRTVSLPARRQPCGEPPDSFALVALLRNQRGKMAPGCPAPFERVKKPRRVSPPQTILCGVAFTSVPPTGAASAPATYTVP
jgi:hypothetical protein